MCVRKKSLLMFTCGIGIMLVGCTGKENENSHMEKVKVHEISKEVPKSKQPKIYTNNESDYSIKKLKSEMFLVNNQNLEETPLIKDYTRSTSSEIVYSGNSKDGQIIEVKIVDDGNAVLFNNEKFLKNTKQDQVASPSDAIKIVKEDHPTKSETFIYESKNKKYPDEDGDLYYKVTRRKQGRKKSRSFMVYIEDSKVKRMKLEKVEGEK